MNPQKTATLDTDATLVETNKKNAPEYRYLAKRQAFEEQQLLPGMEDPQLPLPFPTMQIDSKK